MEAVINFLIRASIYLIILGSAYFILFARQNAMAFNRFFILLTFVLSLGLASIGRIPVRIPQIQNDNEAIAYLPEIVVAGGEVMERASMSIVTLLSSSFFWIPPFISMALLVILILRLSRVFRTIIKNPGEKFNNLHLVYLHQNHSPYSFFRWIFISSAMRGSEHFHKVITHEKAHYILKHSWDILFMEFMRLIFWFHPFYYLLKRELQDHHEFEADHYALKEFPRPEYQKALLDFSMGAGYLPVTNPFNVSTIKKRFIMMNTQRIISRKSLMLRVMLVLPFVLAAFMIQSCDYFDQSAEPADSATDLLKQVEVNEETIFTLVEVDPEYPGGTLKLMHFLQDNLRYPEKAKADGAQGTVFVSFVVEKDGSISDARVLRSVTSELDAEALRVINAMPNWIPGKQRGQDVRVQFNLPIRFVLNN